MENSIFKIEVNLKESQLTSSGHYIITSDGNSRLIKNRRAIMYLLNLESLNKLDFNEIDNIIIQKIK
jgi:hypothetical protein